MARKLVFALLIAALIGAALPAGAKGFVEGDFEYGFFYGTFNENPNVALFAGGPIEDFCDSDPGTAMERVFFKQDGSVDIKVNEKSQSIYLYYTEFNDIPIWLDEICPGIIGGDTPPSPFAAGVADLKVRLSIDGAVIDFFNSINGKATGVDGTEYKVRGSADFVVIDGELQGDPAEFVDFKLTEIKRGK